MGSDNKITGRENISLGSYNEVEGTGNILLGSRIKAYDECKKCNSIGK